METRSFLERSPRIFTHLILVDCIVHATAQKPVLVLLSFVNLTTMTELQQFFNAIQDFKIIVFSAKFVVLKGSVFLLCSETRAIFKAALI